MIPIARPMIGPDERAAVDRVLESGSLTQGPEVEAFEAEFAELVDGRSCVAVNSGTSALHVALLSIGIGVGDEVIVPSFTFAATANAVVLAGATPVFADICPDTFCMDPGHVRSLLSPRTVALMPVHIYGHPADMAELGEIARAHGLALIEDAAQAHAAAVDGRPVGALGDAAAFSFYPTKNMTTGEGGLAVFASEQAARQARLLRNQGMEHQYENEIVGFNLRMTDLAAAIGRVQLRRLPEMTARRRQNAGRLDVSIGGRVQVPIERPGARHVYHQYTVRAPDREQLSEQLADHGVQARVYYPTPVHRLPSFAVDLVLPETERAAAEVLSLPIGPHLSEHDIDAVIEAVLA